jgi:hypothetical protein
MHAPPAQRCKKYPDAAYFDMAFSQNTRQNMAHKKLLQLK